MRFPDGFLLFAALLALCACAPSANDLPLSRTGTGATTNGSNLNGSNLNGQALAETLVHVQFAGARVNGNAVLDEARLEGTVFHGRKGSSLWSGTDFVGANFVGVKGDGTTVPLRITGVVPGTEVWTYDVRYEDAGGEWWPVCKDAGGPTQAIPVTGRWNYAHGVPGGGAKIDDPSSFTFACRGTAAIAKCVDLGYHPWKSELLAAHHQACTRLIRADFCGDGTSHTTDGQWVNLYDGLGIQKDTEEWVVESEWDTAGARCFSPLNRSHSAVACYDQRVEPGCGSAANFATGTLLVNETPGDGISLAL